MLRRSTQASIRLGWTNYWSKHHKLEDNWWTLVDQLRTYQPWKAKPARRVYIPKPGGNQRPLGIPTLADRALQAMVKNSLEPCWEARFEGSSYGFRPGRGCHDAIAKIYNLARPNKRKKWVVDADIKGAFDNIDHEYLLQTIGLCPGRELIKEWLKAGYMEEGVFHNTSAGTPQGGVISPLLANIALHGMEQMLGVRYNVRDEVCASRAVVRYADDFVVFCESREDAQAAKIELETWLAQRGLSLSQEKTRIVHMTEGFDFLGFNIRHYAAPKTTRSGYKLLIKPSKKLIKPSKKLIKPSKKSVTAIQAKLRTEWRTLKGHGVQTVLKRLNPIIRGEANYYRIGVASKIFSDLDYWMFVREQCYARKAHPTKPWYWRKQKYWGKLNGKREDHWVFGDKRHGEGHDGYLLKFSWFGIKRHVLVKGKASVDDPQLKEYWASRTKATATALMALPPRKLQLARNQNHVCRLCGMSLYNGEEVQEHHIRPRATGGTNELGNLTLVHLYCQQQIHSGARSAKDARGEPLLRC